jgi:hypothetical protein
MRWLAATLALLCASAALVAGIYFRDRDPSSWLPPPRTAATLDVKTILLAIHCPAGVCSYRLVSNPRPDHWVARIFNGTTTQCFDIDLLAFDVTETHGVTGATLVGCSRTGAGSGA